LEFTAVHFPALATRYMPTNYQGTRTPAPPSLAQLSMQKTHHEADEECLFFVGLSRARDYLFLSRAERYTAQNASASKFLSPIAGVAPASRYNGSRASFDPPIALRPPGARDSYEERELDIYIGCPARYRYEVIEGLRGLRGLRDESAYLRFHRCVYATVRWLEQERQAGRTIDVPTALTRLAEEWTTNGPVGYGFEAFYRSAAEDMVRGMVKAVATEAGQYDRREWSIAVGPHKIVLTPDRVLKMPDGAIRVQRVRTGRETKSEPDKPIYALLRHGVAQLYPGATTSVEIFYLASGKQVPLPPKNDDKRLQQYTDAIASIEQGDFHPEPDPRRCPNCQCYFMCRG
jgi:hypothetical protein